MPSFSYPRAFSVDKPLGEGQLESRINISDVPNKHMVDKYVCSSVLFMFIYFESGQRFPRIVASSRCRVADRQPIL